MLGHMLGGDGHPPAGTHFHTYADDTNGTLFPRRPHCAYDMAAVRACRSLPRPLQARRAPCADVLAPCLRHLASSAQLRRAWGSRVQDEPHINEQCSQVDVNGRVAA
jgi:hypothetical protein